MAKVRFKIKYVLVKENNKPIYGQYRVVDSPDVSMFGLDEMVDHAKKAAAVHYPEHRFIFKSVKRTNWKEEL